MPITVPAIDDRRYDDLLNEAIARIPVHNPEWTNFNRSDPGITLVELFAFLAENVLYRANLIPERNRLKFLSLLGIPLRPASSAQGLVTFANDRGPLQTVALNSDLEVRAGQIPFRTEAALDVLPLEARVYYKRPVVLSSEDQEVYRRFYASVLEGEIAGTPALEPSAYETTVLDGSDPAGVDLADATAGAADASLWLALLARPQDAARLEEVRAAVAGKTLNVAIVPVVEDAGATLPPAGTGVTEGEANLEYATPNVPIGGRLPEKASDRIPRYLPLDARPAGPPGQPANVLLRPGVVQVTLPDPAGLGLWTNLEPIEEGTGQFPPAIEDSKVADRLVTWLRVRSGSATQARILWMGINAASVVQRTRVAGEVLPAGTGQPDQMVRLSKFPVIPGSVVLTVATPTSGSPPGSTEPVRWFETDDLLAAGPEVPTPDPRVPPGSAVPPSGPTDVFVLDPEAGTIRFGDGLHGRRPALGATLRATYDHGLGKAGNIGPRSVSSGPALPPGFSVTNPIRTWGGADAETVVEGEKQVARYLQHRDRLVNADDFMTIARRTPGVEIGRVEVLAAFDPELAPNAPGGSPGAVTLLLVPRRDPAQPEAPRPDRFFLDAVCAYLDPRRLVTTELFLRGPSYVQIWISAGIDVMPGVSVAEVREAVKAELLQLLSPLPYLYQSGTTGPAPAATYPHVDAGWPLRTAVSRAELAAYATRVPGVRVLNALLLSGSAGVDTESIQMTGLQLPRVAAISVVTGDPVPLDQLRGLSDGAAGDGGAEGAALMTVPTIPEAC